MNKINYDAILTSLEAKRSQIEQSIKSVKTLRDCGVLDCEYRKKEYEGMSVSKATKKYLEKVGTFKSIGDICIELAKGGIDKTKQTVTTTVYSASKSKNSGIRRLRRGLYKAREH